MKHSKEVDYCGIIHLLRCLIRDGKCSRSEGKRIAERIAAEYGVNIVLPL